MQRLRTGWLALGSVALIAVGLPACGSDSGGSSSESGSGGGAKNASFDLTIGDIVPLTGDLAPYGPAGLKGGKIAVQQLNAALKKSGATGVTIKLTSADTESKPQATQQAASKLVDDGASCLVGAYASADTLPLGNGLAVDEETPLISPASTSQEITALKDEGYVFRTAPSDLLQGEVLATAIVKQLGGNVKGKTISIGGRNDAYGAGISKIVADKLKAQGAKTNGPVLYDPNQPSYNSEADKIVGNGSAAAYVIVDFPETFAKVAPALVRTGKFDSKKLWTTDGLAISGGASALKKQNIPLSSLEGSHNTTPAADDKSSSGQDFSTLYEQSSLKPSARQTFDAQNFDATMLCGLAAIKAGSKEGSKIKDALRAVSAPPGKAYGVSQIPEAVAALRKGEDIDYQGASGPVDLDAQGDPTAAVYGISEYTKGNLKQASAIKVGKGS